MIPRRARICRSTGLRLIPSAGFTGFHVAKVKYAQPSAVRRTPDVHRDEWGRYDTLGRTYYVASTAACAYAEVLAPFKRLNGTDDPLEADARVFDITVDELLREIATQWGELDFHGIGTVPPRWRDDRRLFRVTMPTEGWFVDVEHPASIAKVNEVLESFLASQGIKGLTRSVLQSDNRYVTTTIADMIFRSLLDDGQNPLGVHFSSKHGRDWWCRAIRLPDDPDCLGLSADAGTRITASDAQFRSVAEWFRLRA